MYIHTCMYVCIYVYIRTCVYMHFKYICGSDDKESACNAGDLGLTPGIRKILWSRKWQPTPVILPGKFHGQRSYNPWGCRVRRH